MWPRWVRGMVAGWIGLDSSKRKGIDIFWILIALILGPLMAPFYMAARPLLSGEERRGSFLWNAAWNFERLFSLLMSMAGLAVLLQNFLESETGDFSKVKRAEIKAGSIAGFIGVLILFCLSGLLSAAIRGSFESDLPAEKSY